MVRTIEAKQFSILFGMSLQKTEKKKNYKEAWLASCPVYSLKDMLNKIEWVGIYSSATASMKPTMDHLYGEALWSELIQ